MNPSPIKNYLGRTPEGWIELPPEMLLPGPLGPDYTCSFFSPEMGIQLLCTIRPTPVEPQEPMIHASLGIFSTVCPDSPERIAERIVLEAGNILWDFFPTRTFCRLPDDPRLPTMKHFFHLFQWGEVTES